MSTQEKEYKRLRKYLNPAIRGKKTDAILNTLALGSLHLVNNIEAVNDSLYIVSAQDRYLEQRLGDYGITKPSNVGLSDETFREIGIEVKNRKQIRDLIHQLLRLIYGEIYTRATSPSSALETYALEDGDNLFIKFDDGDLLEIVFKADQFQNIFTATAQEVANAITIGIRKLGKTGSAFIQDNGLGNFVVLMSETDGPASAVQVLGGKAQNTLRFNQIRLSSGDSTTQWTLTQVSGGSIRATWSGGADPSVGKVKKNDYVNIYGTAFDILNRGTFTITNVQGGTVGNAFIEFENPNGVAEIVVQGSVEAILFFNPQRRTIINNARYAAPFQTSPGILEIFMPATTRVVRRERQGAAHIQDNGLPSVTDNYGPYIYDETKAYVIGEISTSSSIVLNASSESVISVADSSQFPDEQGHLVLSFGTEIEEGPVPYISKPSSSTLRINPSYVIKNSHPIGADITLLAQNSPIDVSIDGSDFPFYITDSVAGRIYAQDLINEIAATGITIIITVLYGDDTGLSKWGTEFSDKYVIWGEEV